MELDHQISAEIAECYFDAAEPLKSLGWGISGFVYLSPDSRTAVKIHRRHESFLRELEVYRRLRSLKISQLHGLTIPKLRGYRSDVRLIQMDFVGPPYLLDFAGVTYDPPDFPEDTMQRWHASIDEYFGLNAWVAHAVYHSLAQHGLYYTDFRPSNLRLDGLPGLEPSDPPGYDDL
ncbi:MAG TPA: hypothetical protein VK324_08570 [Tepidisphaeraceae bacterium]|nr:hypothetical protein [Tepidisphaeraceae bacterium]